MTAEITRLFDTSTANLMAAARRYKDMHDGGYGWLLNRLADALESENRGADTMFTSEYVDALRAKFAPRVVSTVAELDALPADSIIRSKSGSAWRKDARAPGGGWTQTRMLGSGSAERVGLPATVLWVGGTE